MPGGGLWASRRASGTGVGTRPSGLRKPTLPQFSDKKSQGRRLRANSAPQRHQLLRFRGPNAAGGGRLPPRQQSGSAHRDGPPRAAESDGLGPASAPILRNKPGNHVEGRRKDNRRGRPGARSTDAFPTNTDLEDWQLPEGGSDPASSMVFTTTANSVAQGLHTDGLRVRRVQAGWRTSAPTRPPITSTRQSQGAARRAVPAHLNPLRFRPGTGAKAE